MAKNLRLSSTALAAAFVLALVAASSTVRPVGAGRPAPGDDPNAVMRGTTTAAAAISATKQQPDQTAAATPTTAAADARTARQHRAETHQSRRRGIRRRPPPPHWQTRTPAEADRSLSSLFVLRSLLVTDFFFCEVNSYMYYV